MKVSKKKFGASVRAWRKGKGMKQKFLAELLEISQGSMCEIETGGNLPNANTIANFVRFTDFPVLDELVKAMK